MKEANQQNPYAWSDEYNDKLTASMQGNSARYRTEPPTLYDDKPIFTVIEKATGKRYEVYADGRITGFEGGCIVINRIPTVFAQIASFSHRP